MATSYQRDTLELHGSYPDLIPADAPGAGWNVTNNVWFQNGETRRVFGDMAVYGAPSGGAPIAIVFYTNAAGEHFWVYATLTGVWALTAGGYSNITPATGWSPTTASLVSMDTYNGLVIVNDSVSGPFYWAGTVATKCVPLPGWPAGWRCMSMRGHKGFLFAVGRLDMGGIQRVNWSDAAEAGAMPTSWTPAADNLAGFVDLLPASSPAIDGFTLRDDFLVFKGESVHAFTFTGGAEVFTVRQRFKEVGLAGLDGWCRSQGDEAIFVGSDGDIYRTDGLNVTSILEGKGQRVFSEEMAPDQLRTVSAGTLFRQNVSLIAYASSAAVTVADRAITYDWVTGELGFRDLPAGGLSCIGEGRFLQDTTPNTWDGSSGTWDSDAPAWNFSLSAATGDDLVGGGPGAGTGSFWWLSGEDDRCVPYLAYALKQGLAFGDPQRRKLVARVWPKIVGEAGELVRIRVGSQEAAGGAAIWAEPVDFEIGQDWSVDAFLEGRYLALEVTASGGRAWRMGSVDVEYRGLGGW